MLPRGAAFAFAWLCAQAALAEGVVAYLSARELLTLTDIEGLSLSPDKRWAVFQLRRADPAANRYETGWYVVPTQKAAPPRFLANAGEPMLSSTGAIVRPAPVWSPDGRWIVYLGQDQGKVQLWRIDFEGKNAEQLTHATSDPRKVAISPDGRKILFDTVRSRQQIEAALRGEGRGGYLFDQRFNPIVGSTPMLSQEFGSGETGRPVRVFDIEGRTERPATAEERVQFSDLTKEGVGGISQGQRIELYEAAAMPRKLVSIDRDTGEIETLFDPNPNLVSRVPTPRHLMTRTASGSETDGYLVLPPRDRGVSRLPLIIVTYRCAGFLRGGVGDEYPIYPFASQGFAVLCHDVADAGYEHVPPERWDDIEAWARGPGDPEKHRVQEGLDAAIAQLDAMGIIDIERVGLTGLSFGAETVSFAMFNMRHLAAAIASYSDLNPSIYYLTDDAGRARLAKWGLGPLETTPQRWRALALSLNAGKARAPLLLNVSDREYLTSVEAVIALRDAGKPVEMYVYPDEYHNKWQPAHRLAIYERNIDWMNFWLRAVEDPDPMKASQSGRWRRLRELRGTH